MSKRMFEHSDEGKFWEVWAEGDKIFTRHGKLGANGQTKIKAGGADELTKMVKDKIREGYVQTGGDVDKGPELDKKELKKLLGTIKSRSDEGVLVLADWLQQQNHPWGELIVLQHGAATGKKALAKQADKYLKENAPSILGELANDKFSSFDWERGLIKRAVIGSPADPKSMIKAVKSLGSNPAAALADTVVVCPYKATFNTWRDWGSSEEHVENPWTDLDGIAKAIPSSITRIGLGGWPAPAAAGYVEMPSFAKVSSAFGDRATALELTGWTGEKPSKLSLPKCVELAVRLGGGAAAPI
jgi:predicted DNA-binding WGR domain protein